MFTCQVLIPLLPPHHWEAFSDLLATTVVSEWDNSSWPSLGINLKCSARVTAVLFSAGIPLGVGVGSRGYSRHVKCHC